MSNVLNNISALQPNSAPIAASNLRRGQGPSFDQALSGVAPGAPAGEQNFATRYLSMWKNPFLKSASVANGGYGLEAMAGASGFGGPGEARAALTRLASAASQAASQSVVRHGQGPSGWSSGAAGLAGGGPRATASPLVAATPSALGHATLGDLSRRFESGNLGPAAIGYDPVGGTSYGLYQIASRVGSMDAFIDYCHDKAPDIAVKLSAAGPANTGGREGKMPDAWRAIAEAGPKRFADLQRDFIRDSHYLPAARGVEDKTGLSLAQMSPALKEVLWSTAVQHGPQGATRIFASSVEHAREMKLTGKTFEAEVIDAIYDLRADRFGSQPPRIQAAVRDRFEKERDLALLMHQGRKA